MVIAKLTVQALERLPKNMISRAFGAISGVELPKPVQKAVNTSFARLVGVDLDEAQRGPEDYASLNHFFTRALREGVRPLDEAGDDGLISPVDGRLGAFGTVDEGVLLQAKGREYKILDLVDSAQEARRFQGGSFITIYLSPRDYHRIHSPVQGRVSKISYIPGHLFPVNPFAVKNIDELFAVNERLITYLETPKLGRVAVIKVGATCVGRITLSFDPFVTNQRLRRREEFEPQELFEFAPGDELAAFNLGSTVILLIEDPTFKIDETFGSGDLLRLGQRLGQRVA